MPGLTAAERQFNHGLRELLHRIFGLLRGDSIRRPGPDVADGHAAETARMAFSVTRFDFDVDIDQKRLGLHASTEFDGSPKRYGLKRAVSTANADVGRFRHVLLKD